MTIARKVAEMAALMRLSDRLDRAAGRLNVNEMQRLAIGRSAIVRPEIFLLDEPLSNLDAAFRAEMRTELKHLQREIQQTMVYVTHDQIEAMSMADRIRRHKFGCSPAVCITHRNLQQSCQLVCCEVYRQPQHEPSKLPTCYRRRRD